MNMCLYDECRHQSHTPCTICDDKKDIVGEKESFKKLHFLRIFVCMMDADNSRTLPAQFAITKKKDIVGGKGSLKDYEYLSV